MPKLGETAARVFFAALAAFAYSVIWTVPSEHGLGRVELVVKNARNEDGEKLRLVYTGVEALDETARLLVACFYPVTRDLASILVNVELFSVFIGLYAVMLLEAHRRGASLFQRVPLVWAMIAQMITGAATVPAYYAVTAGSALDGSTWDADNSFVHGVIPGVLFGGLIPTVILLTPKLFTSDQHQIVIATWQLVPVYMSILSNVFAKILPRPRQSVQQTVKNTYLFFGVIALLGHLIVLYDSFVLNTVSWEAVFVAKIPKEESFHGAMHLFFQYDMYFVGLAFVAWTAAVTGRNNGLGVIATFLLLLVGSVVVGPGAAPSFALWKWREPKRSAVKVAKKRE